MFFRNIPGSLTVNALSNELVISVIRAVLNHFIP